MKAMALELSVFDSEEFENMVSQKDVRISKALIQTILNNLEGKKRHYHALTVTVEQEQTVYDITVDREDFIVGLESNLSILEFHEEYELCAEVVKAIKTIKSAPKKKRGRPKKKND